MIYLQIFNFHVRDDSTALDSYYWLNRYFIYYCYYYFKWSIKSAVATDLFQCFHCCPHFYVQGWTLYFHYLLYFDHSSTDLLGDLFAGCGKKYCFATNSAVHFRNLTLPFCYHLLHSNIRSYCALTFSMYCFQYHLKLANQFYYENWFNCGYFGHWY
jgi:hypothetical protein